MNVVVVDIKKDHTKIALLKEGNALEILIDIKDRRSKVGNIYLATVRDVYPKFCFVTLKDKDGEEEMAFLQEQGLKVGENILVQVHKDKQITSFTQPKLTFVSTAINLAGKYVVLRKNSFGITVSKKLLEEESKASSVSKFCPEGFGLVLRTASKNVALSVIEEEIKYLHEKFINMDTIDTPSILYSPNEIIYFESSLRNLIPEAKKVVTNNNIDEIRKICSGYELSFTAYNENHDLFEEYEVYKQMDLREKVWLKRGGYILIEQTKALIVVDVNTGKASQKDLFFKTNKEASCEIAKQLRLRNLSGMILIDFINMTSKDDRDELLKYFIEEVNKDRIKVNVLGFTNLGLLELTRKKTREPLKTTLYHLRELSGEFHE